MVVQDGYGASAKDKQLSHRLYLVEQLKVAQRRSVPPDTPQVSNKKKVDAVMAVRAKAKLRTKYGHTRLTGGAAGNL